MAASKKPLVICSPLVLALGALVAACGPEAAGRPNPAPGPTEQAPEPPHEVPEKLRDQPNGFVPVSLIESPSMPASCSKCPAGTCTTSGESWCGGVHPPGGWEERRAKEVEWWICEKTPPGCPARRPDDGEACSEEGHECAYGGCGFDKARCKGGHWERFEVHPM